MSVVSLKMRDDIAMPFRNVDDLEGVGVVAEENGVAVAGEASDAAAELASKRGEPGALILQTVDEIAGGGQARALASNMFEDGEEVGDGGVEQYEPTHSEAGIRQRGFAQVQGAGDLFRGIFSAGGKGSRERFAERLELGFAFLDEAKAFTYDFAR